ALFVAHRTDQMNRLQKKCVIGTAGVHLLLGVILVVVPAFFYSKPKADDLQVLDVIPANLIDAAFNSGVANAGPPPPPPGNADNDEANTRVSVTIANDGTVISARIVTPSGDTKVDASIQRTLERVTYIAPFPKGAVEKERTYIINFNLKA